MVRNRIKKIFAGHSKTSLFLIFSGASIIFILLFIAAFAPFLAPYDPLALEFELLQPPSQEHPYGTDTLGRDVLSRVIYGGRTSISVATLSVLISLAVSIPLGAIVTYNRGKLDKLMMLIMDALWVYPLLILALIVVVLFGPSFTNLALTVAIAVIPSLYRVVRSLTLTLKEQGFIEAEKSLGARTSYIVYKHIIPYTIPTFVVLASLNLAQAMIIVSSLSFLGLGVTPPTPDWGTDLFLGNRVWLRGDWWCVFFPAMMIFLAVAGFNLLGEGLDSFLREGELYAGKA